MTKKPNKYSQKVKRQIEINGKTIDLPLFDMRELDDSGNEVVIDSNELLKEEIKRTIKRFESAKGNYTKSQLEELEYYKNPLRRDSNGIKNSDYAFRDALIAKGII